MKTKPILIIIGTLLFYISFFLPSYHTYLGYECAKLCSFDILEDLDLFNIEFYYYFSFTFSNIMMIILPILLLSRYRNAPTPLYLCIIQVILLLHVISWLFPVGDINEIKIGYYVWLLSMCIILYVSIKSKLAE